jgi:hypothetical protein
MDGGGAFRGRSVASMRINLTRHTTSLIVLLIAVLSGCTHLKPVAMDPSTLQKNIRMGTLVHKGDTVRIVTRDGVSHEVIVTEVDEHTLRGHATGAPPGAVAMEIPISDILTLEEERVDVQETASGSIGVMAIVFAVIFIIAPVAVLSAFGAI